MGRTCKKCYMPLGDAEVECSNCGAQNPIPVQMRLKPEVPEQTGKQKKSKLSIFITVGIVLLLAALVAVLASQCTTCFVEKEEVEYSANVWNDTPAYIHVRTVVPVYAVRDNYGGNVHHVVCRCITTSGSTVWLYISTSDYHKYMDKDATFDGFFGAQYKTVYFANHVIHGEVKSTADYDDSLSDQIGPKLLVFESLEKK